MHRLVLRAHVWVVAALIVVVVKLPLPWVLWLVTPWRWWQPYRSVSPDTIAQAVRRRLARPRQMKRRACLREGLTLFHFLCLAGHEPEMHFAVFPPDQAPRPMHAHCWVTLDGHPCSAPPQQPCAEVLHHSRAAGSQPPNRILP